MNDKIKITPAPLDDILKKTQNIREIFKLDGERYYLDSLPESDLIMMDSIVEINNIIKEHQKHIKIAKIAKDTIIEQLSKNVNNFEKVESQD
jgi:hypothetical protein